MVSFMGKENPDHELSPGEIESRRDAALLRALSTPHKRQKEMKVGRPRTIDSGELVENIAVVIRGAVERGREYLSSSFGESLLVGKAGERVCIAGPVTFSKAKLSDLVRINYDPLDFPMDGPIPRRVGLALKPYLVRGKLVIDEDGENCVVIRLRDDVGDGE
jgi:hypothetical protein